VRADCRNPDCHIKLDAEEKPDRHQRSPKRLSRSDLHPFTGLAAESQPAPPGRAPRHALSARAAKSGAGDRSQYDDLLHIEYAKAEPI
jgi:hypothetical protein